MQIKKIIFSLVLVIFAVLSMYYSESAIGFFHKEKKADMMQIYREIVKQKTTLDVCAKRYIASPKSYMYRKKWDRAGKKWNERLLVCQQQVKQYGNEYPLTCDYFHVALRMLHAVYLEYDHIFLGNTADTTMLDERIEKFDFSMAELKRELDFIEKKKHYLSKPSSLY